MSDLDEQDLIRRAVLGERVAAESLLIGFQMRVHLFVRQHFPASLREFTTVEDVVQDVYLKAYANIRSLRATTMGGVLAWLNSIAHNVLINLQYRFALRRPVDLTSDDEKDVARVLESLAVYKRTPSQSAAEHEFMLAVEDSLERLPEQYRQVVRLRHLDGLSAAETSEKLHISVELVWLHCTRGLKALRSELEKASQSIQI